MSGSPPQPAARPDLAEMLEAERRRIASEVQTRILDQARLVLAQVGFYEQAAAEGSVARTQFGVVAALLRQLLENALELEAGTRVNAVLRPVAATGPTLTIRKIITRRLSWDDLLSFDCLSPQMLDFLRLCVQAQLNIVISGVFRPTGYRPAFLKKFAAHGISLPLGLLEE